MQLKDGFIESRSLNITSSSVLIVWSHICCIRNILFTQRFILEYCIRTLQGVIGNGIPIMDENKVNEVADKFRSEYGVEISCFLFLYITVRVLMKQSF